MLFCALLIQISMFINLYILKKVVQNLQNKLIGSKILSIYIDQNKLINFQFYDGVNIIHLKVSIIPEHEAIFVEKVERKTKKSINIFKNLLGEVVQQIELIPYSRIVCLDLINYKLFFQLFGKSQNNIFITDLNLNILNSIKNKKEYLNKSYEIEQPKLIDWKNFPEHTKLLQALSRSKYFLGKYFAREILYRLNIDFETNIGKLSENSITLIDQQINNLIEEIETSEKFYILGNTEKERLLSPIKLVEYPLVVYETNDFFAALTREFYHRIGLYKFKKLHQQLLNIDRNILDKYERKLQKFHEIPKLQELVNQYTKFAELLYTYPNLKQKGIKTLTLQDYNGEFIDIPLDEKLTVIQNIEKYYSKAKKINQDILFTENKYNVIVDEYNTVKQRFEKLKIIDNYTDLKRFYKQHSQIYKPKMLNISKEPTEKFRKFQLSENAVLYVGKDARNNDELTFGFAKPNDYWFHLRGGSGSHCVLKYDGSKPPKEIIEKAASIAAYYSSQKNAGFVPVIFTQRKFIRKPKGANPGTVVVSREEVIMVEPRSYDEIK